MKKIIFLFYFFVCVTSFSQISTPFSLYKQFNGQYGYTIIGNTHNAFDNRQTPSPPCQMDSSSSAILNLLPTQTIMGAYLIWTGIGNGNFSSVTLNGNFQSPDFINNSAIGANSNIQYFSAVKEITTYVQSFGNGNYFFNNFNLNPILFQHCTNNNYLSGWNVVIVYSDTSVSPNQLNIYTGLRWLGSSFINSISIPIQNIQVTDTLNANMSVISWNGSSNWNSGESILFNGDTLSNALSPPNNPFNSSNSFTGSTTNWNHDVDQFDISGAIDIGDTDAVITVNSFFLRFLSTIITSIPSELPDATATLDSISGQEICENRDLAIDFTIFNINSNDTLPAGTPISFFVNDSIFVSTVLTTSQILIGDSLVMSSTVSIPTGISSPFSLSIIANQDSTELGVIPESNLTNNTSNDIILSLNEIFIPTFDSIAPVCFGTNVVLPTTSTNGVAGTWSPAFNNQATTTYLFTPNGNNCVDSVELTVQIVSETLPTFTLADSICATGTLLFPTISSNSVIGSWSPAFDNQNSTTYTFLPDSVGFVSEGCPVSMQKLVTIVPQTLPSFSFVDSLCVGASFALPNTSNNGILGTWSAAFNNQATTSYTFTPTTFSIFNGCALSTTETITIIPTLLPTFTISDSLCADVAFSLPTNSNENVLGTWSPVFNNQATQNYIFTPNSSGIVSTNLGARCPLTASQTVVNVPRTPTPFSLPDSICIGASLTLPTISNNSISGTWSPVFNNQATTLYTFSPTVISVANNCPLPAQSTIIVDPFVQPIFVSFDSICQGNLVTLPTLSENLINGNWSPVFDNQSTTTYTFTPSDPGCISTAQMTVPVFPLITPTFSFTDSICHGDTLVFPTVSDNGISGTWSPSLNNQETTTYTFTPNVNECASSVQWTVQVAPRITTNFSLYDTLCAGGTLIFPSISDNNISGSWSPVLNNQQTATYIFTQVANECATSANFTLVVLPAQISFDTIVRCENDLPFVWNGQSLTSSITTSAILQNQYGCDSVANLIFFAYPSPQLDVELDPWSGCLPIALSFTNNGQNPSSIFSWDFGNGQTSNSFDQVSTTYMQPGCYDVSLSVTNEYGCEAAQFLPEILCIESNPVAIFEVQNKLLSPINSTTNFENNSEGAMSWLWNFGDGTHDENEFYPTHTFPNTPGSYKVTLTVSNQNGCSDSISQLIVIEQDPVYFVPNTFTPNGDEFNQLFSPIFADNVVISSYELKIYNRWGELIFESQTPEMGWDGTFNGIMVQDGVYSYSITFLEAGFTKSFEVYGSVRLFR